LKEIAQQTGFSLSTVSLALKGDPRVAEKTRARVERVARSIGYEPHAAGRALVTGRTQLIGFLSAGDALTYYDSGILAGLTSGLEERDYHVVVFRAEPWSVLTPQPLLRRMVDGLVFSLCCNPRFLAALLERCVPVVVVDPLEAVRCDSVRADERQGMHQAVQHLLDLGHRRIAYIGAAGEQARLINRERWDAFVAEMSDAGLAVNPGGEAVGLPKELAERTMDSYRPTGLVCFSDWVAARAIGWLRERGLTVPDDLSVVSFDDDEYADLLNPSLTTVRLPFHEMGAAASKMVLERIETPDMEPRKVIIPGGLIVRGSTGPAPG